MKESLEPRERSIHYTVAKLRVLKDYYSEVSLRISQSVIFFHRLLLRVSSIKRKCEFDMTSKAERRLAKSTWNQTFMHIRDLRRIRPMLDFKTASTIATSIVHSKLDYCNSLFLSLDSTQIHRLQLIQNSLARAVTRTPRHHHITPVLKS